MSDKNYYCKDFQIQKSGKTISAGIFAPGVYAVVKYEFGSSTSNGHNEYYKISEEEFNGFPENEDAICSKLFSNLFGRLMFRLCSDYVEHDAFFTQKKYDSI